MKIIIKGKFEEINALAFKTQERNKNRNNNHSLVELDLEIKNALRDTIINISKNYARGRAKDSDMHVFLGLIKAHLNLN